MILAVDSSGRELCVALLAPGPDAGIVPVWQWPGGWGNGHSLAGARHQEALFDLVTPLVREAGGWAAVSSLAVVRGPGSYTGLRVGLSAAAGIAYARRLPIHPLSSLSVAAHRLRGEGPMVALVNAGRGRVHAQAFHRSGAVRVPRDEPRLLELVQVAAQYRGVAVGGEPSLTDGLGRPGEAGVPGPQALAAATAEAAGAGEVVGYDGLEGVYGES